MGVVEFGNVVWNRGNDDLTAYIPTDFGSGFWILETGVGGRSLNEKTPQFSHPPATSHIPTQNPRVTLSTRAIYMLPHTEHSHVSFMTYHVSRQNIHYLCGFVRYR